MGVTITEDSFGSLYDEETKVLHPIQRFTLKNSNGASVQLISYGAIITTINVPDRSGNLADVNLGFDDIDGYTKSKIKPYFGAVVGRVANRIKKSQFNIDGRSYKVSANAAGDNHLHGGFKGFDKRIWDANVAGSKVTFSYLSKDGEEGYPGCLLVNATYSLSDENAILLELTATCTKPTPVNLTNHAYFNLAGHDQGAEAFYEHKVCINADAFTPAVDTIPTGEIKNVDGTAFDLREPKLIKEAFPKTPSNGYDNNFCVIQPQKLKCGNTHQLNFVARAVHPKSGRVLEVFSDQPGVQFYTSNFLPADDSLPGKGKAFYKKHGAFCLETQNFPDAVNNANFPNSILLPGEVYKHTALFKFSVNK